MEKPADPPADPWDEPLPPYWKCVVAALPALLAGLQFLMVALFRKPFLGAGQEDLILVMQVEFLVVHSTALLGIIALRKPKTVSGRIARAIAFWLVAAAYAYFALKFDFRYFVAFVSLSFVTYLGMFFAWRSSTADMQLGARWIAAAALLMISTAHFDAPSMVNDWPGKPSVVAAGALYFLGLAALDLMGIFLFAVPFIVPLFIRWWNREPLFRDRKKRV